MNVQSRSDLTLSVRNKALELGFDACGFARAEPLDREAFRLENWLQQNLHGSMSWMERNFDKRVDPTLLVPGAKSVVSVIMGYRNELNEQSDLSNNGPKIAKYARGRDYHKVFKRKLKKLFQFTDELTGGVNGRFFVDSAPVMDKVWAQRAGLGWIGKNSNLLNKKFGSWFLIGEMITDIPFVPDLPVTDHCGSCTLCIDACPTNAIHEPYRVDARRCISYLTIELKERCPELFQEQMSGWMFGCDICQDVCPWNRKADYGTDPGLMPRQELLTPPDDGWSRITEEQYLKLFEGTAVKRASFSKFAGNALIAEKSLPTK
ncbi:MAG: tRNA epoxyqueuosine(34) reductase QueG [Balneolaceae bacterium]|nr:MAG: tRNA epoxyqueuosine(34) reductase QueG [Balneolaceae bacterium]